MGAVTKAKASEVYLLPRMVLCLYYENNSRS